MTEEERSQLVVKLVCRADDFTCNYIENLQIKYGFPTTFSVMLNIIVRLMARHILLADMKNVNMDDHIELIMTHVVKHISIMEKTMEKESMEKDIKIHDIHDITPTIN